MKRIFNYLFRTKYKDDNRQRMALAVVCIILLALLMFMLQGCALVWTDHVFAITIAKDYVAEEVYIEDDVTWLTSFDSDAADVNLKVDPRKLTVGVVVEETE